MCGGKSNILRLTPREEAFPPSVLRVLPTEIRGQNDKKMAWGDEGGPCESWLGRWRPGTWLINRVSAGRMGPGGGQWPRGQA